MTTIDESPASPGDVLLEMIDKACILEANHSGASADELRARWRNALAACSDQELWMLADRLDEKLVAPLAWVGR